MEGGLDALSLSPLSRRPLSLLLLLKYFCCSRALLRPTFAPICCNSRKAVRGSSALVPTAFLMSVVVVGRRGDDNLSLVR